MKSPRFYLLAFGALILAACAPVSADPTSDPASGPATMTLERTLCFGFCPDYTVSITSDGAVTFEGRRFVAMPGEQHAQIPAADARALLARFDAVDFMNLRDEYVATNITDLPTYTLTLERNGQRKTVRDYAGPSVGMPAAAHALEDEIDRVANTARWVLRDGQPVREPSPQEQRQPK